MNVRRLVNRLLAASLMGCVLVLLGCGGGGRVLYQSDLGRAPAEEILLGVAESVLQSHGFQRQLATTRFIETQWRLLGTRDELYRTGGNHRDRARVEVSPRGTGLFVGRLVMVHEVEMEDGSWVEQPPPQELEAEYVLIRQEVLQRLTRYMDQR